MILGCAAPRLVVKATLQRRQYGPKRGSSARREFPPSPTSTSTKKRKKTNRGSIDHSSFYSSPAILKRAKTAVTDECFPSSTRSDLSRITPGLGRDFSIKLARKSLLAPPPRTQPVSRQDTDAKSSKSFFHVPQLEYDDSVNTTVAPASTAARPAKQTPAHIMPLPSLGSLTNSFRYADFEVTPSPFFQPQAKQATLNTTSQREPPAKLGITQQPLWSGFQRLRPGPGSSEFQQKHKPDGELLAFDNSDVWDYIQPHLASCPKSSLRSMDLALLRYPLQRTLSVGWQQRLRKHGLRATHSKDFTACLVFLTGSESLCTNCGGVAEQPFEECIALPAGVPQELIDHFGVFSCTNCFVQSQPRPCVFVRSQNKATTSTRRTVNLALQNGVLEPSKPQRNWTSDPSEANPVTNQCPLDGAKSKTDPYSQIPEEVPVLEGESWEFAPGRVHVVTDEGLDDVAFSNAYLNHSHSIQISEQVACHAITIRACTSHYFKIDPNRLQVCFLASGKLSVKIQGKDFKLGPQGLIKIKPGVSAVAENWHYVDAKVQITAIFLD